MKNCEDVKGATIAEYEIMVNLYVMAINRFIGRNALDYQYVTDLEMAYKTCLKLLKEYKGNETEEYLRMRQLHNEIYN